MALGAGCRADLCESRPPAFEISLTLDIKVKPDEVSKLWVEVIAAGKKKQQPITIDEQLDDLRTGFSIEVGTRGQGGFDATVTVEARGSGDVVLARGQTGFRGSGDACNFQTLNLARVPDADGGLDAGDGGLDAGDASVDLPMDSGADLKDMATPDISTPDIATEDSAVDLPAKDKGLTPDKPVPDKTTPDMALDKPKSDMAQADALMLDKAVILDGPQDAPPNDYFHVYSDLPPMDALLPDGPIPDKKICGSTAQCDDKLFCTMDSCTDAGVCQHVVNTVFCVIGGQCIVNGTVNKANKCQVCTPSANPWGWSDDMTHVCSDGKLYTHGDKCVGGVCKGTPYICDDKLACTTDVYKGTGPAPGGCDFLLHKGYCRINGACYKDGAVHPTDKCLKCDVSRSTTTWQVAAVSGCVFTFSDKAPKSHMVRMAPAGKDSLYVSDRNNDVVYVVTPSKATKLSGGFDQPHGVAAFAGGVLVADRFNHVIKYVYGGSVVTYAGSGIATKGVDGPALSAKIPFVDDVVVDAKGVVYLTDSTSVRKIENGKVTRVAGSLGGVGFSNGPALSSHLDSPAALAFDGKGALYIACSWSIRKLDKGYLTVVAGNGKKGSKDGAAATAQFNGIMGIAVDPTGKVVYVSDANNALIRQISGGTVTTLLGGNTTGCKDGALSKATITLPQGLMLDSAGHLYFVDSACNKIRILVP